MEAWLLKLVIQCLALKRDTPEDFVAAVALRSTEWDAAISFEPRKKEKDKIVITSSRRNT